MYTDTPGLGVDWTSILNQGIQTAGNIFRFPAPSATYPPSISTPPFYPTTTPTPYYAPTQDAGLTPDNLLPLILGGLLLFMLLRRR